MFVFLILISSEYLKRHPLFNPRSASRLMRQLPVNWNLPIDYSRECGNIYPIRLQQNQISFLTFDDGIRLLLYSFRQVDWVGVCIGREFIDETVHHDVTVAATWTCRDHCSRSKSRQVSSRLVSLMDVSSWLDISEQQCHFEIEHRNWINKSRFLGAVINIVYKCVSYEDRKPWLANWRFTIPCCCAHEAMFNPCGTYFSVFSWVQCRHLIPATNAWAAQAW